jgi:hypothetical protein
VFGKRYDALFYVFGADTNGDSDKCILYQSNNGDSAGCIHFKREIYYTKGYIAVAGAVWNVVYREA